MKILTVRRVGMSFINCKISAGKTKKREHKTMGFVVNKEW
jgi:hypothetical protein